MEEFTVKRPRRKLPTQLKIVKNFDPCLFHNKRIETERVNNVTDQNFKFSKFKDGTGFEVNPF